MDEGSMSDGGLWRCKVRGMLWSIEPRVRRANSSRRARHSPVENNKRAID
jgi:hypothetical protein